MPLRIILLVLLFGGCCYYGYSQWGIGRGLGAVGALLLVGVVLYAELRFPERSI